MASRSGPVGELVARIVACPGTGRRPRRRLWEKLANPLVWPIDLGPPELLLAVMAAKYNQDPEVGYASAQVEEGLEPIEQLLVSGPMAKRGSVLDVGCGAGREAIALARLGYRVVGIDIASRMIETARRNADERELRVVFTKFAAHEVSPELGSFDYVLTTPGFYQFVPTRALRIQTLRALGSVLAPDGLLFLSAPWMPPTYWPGFRATVVDWLRHLHRVMPGWGFASEPGDRLIRVISPVSDPARAIFHHVFYGRDAIEEEIGQAGLVGEPIRHGMWTLRTGANLGLPPK